MPIFDVDSRQSVTANAVTLTLTLDEDTCLELSRIFMDLGEALGRARRSYKASRQWKEQEPWRKTQRANLKVAIEARLKKLMLPGRKAVSIIAREFEMSYDRADFLITEIRREERRKAALEREREIMRLSKSGWTAKSIADHFQLSAGTVRNILSRRRRAAALPAPVADEAV